MSSTQHSRAAARSASDQTDAREGIGARGEHDAISQWSGPPDYATLDPNELNRSITPFPRPKSPTPSQMAAWPLADADDENRPDSNLSYTSSRPYNSRSKSHLSKSKRGSSKNTDRPNPSADRRNRKRALSSGSPPESPQKKSRLQIPALVRLAPRRNETAMPQVGSSGSLATTVLRNDKNDQSTAEGHKKRGGILRQLSHGDWTTVGSFFSQSAHSGSPQRTIGPIGRPFDFRHEGGIGTSSSAFMTHADLTVIPSVEVEDPQNERTRTSAILMDIRTESRLGNRTSLPVTMPNAISPIDNTIFDADCGRDSTVRALVRNTINPFHSPPSPHSHPSPTATVIHTRSTTRELPRDGDVYGNAFIDRLKFSNARLIFWLMAAFTQTCTTVATASVTITITDAHKDKKADAGALIALCVSVIGIFIFGTLLAVAYVQRASGRFVHEQTSIRVETWFSKMSPDEVLFWVLVMLAELGFLSMAAGVTVMAVRSHNGEDADAGIIIWFIISVVIMILVSVFLTPVYATRISNRIVREHRAEQRDEDWVELTSSFRANVSATGNQSRLVRDIMRSASQDNRQNRLNRGSSSTHNHSLSFNADVIIHNSQMSGHDLPQGQIGIARSDSLMRQQNNDATSSMSSSATATTKSFESEQTSEPVVYKRSASPATQVASDPVTVLSAEEMSMISMPKQHTYIPHSLGMADLSSETPAQSSPSVTTSTTKSTIASLISSYASEPVTRVYSPELLGRRGDALNSHPILTHLRPIITEAGTPNSQKSGDRIPGSGYDGDLKTSWSIRDGLATRMATMTPIEERSEAGTRSSMLAGHRISQSVASDHEILC